MASRVLFSYEDLLQTPDDGKRYEILDGDLLVSAAPLTGHQYSELMLIEFLLKPHNAGYGQLWMAPTDVVLDEHNVVEPDVFFICQDRLHIVTDKNVQGPPDLVIEILSPGGRARDIGVKLDAYARFGVPHYWVVDPEARNVRVYLLQNGGYGEANILEGDDLLSCPLFPEFTVPVHQLFR